jgi:hypothetical protein
MTPGCAIISKQRCYSSRILEKAFRVGLLMLQFLSLRALKNL